jgi:hypothetical protein
LTTPNTPRRPAALATNETAAADLRNTGVDKRGRQPPGWHDIARRLCRIGSFDANRVAGVLRSLDAGLYVTDAVALADGVLAAQAASQSHCVMGEH